MDWDNRPHQALDAAIARLLRPLFRLLLRHSVSFGAFEDLAKRTYIQVALDDFGIPGKKPSISRASILSGLTRKEVQRLVSVPRNDGSEAGEHYNRAARVVTGWVRDTAFLDANGEPRPLAPDGDPSFAALVRRYSGDMPARAVLDELLRVGAVQQRKDGRIELLTRAYVPQGSAVEKLRILGTDVADLIETIDHNLQHGATDARFQRKVMYQSMPADAVPAFRKLSAAQSQALLEKLDRWLAAHDIDNPRENRDAPRARIGVGIYYFEERLESPTPEKGFDMNIKLMAAIAVTAGASLLASCGGGGGGGGIGGTGSPTGMLHVSMTDAPACGYDAVNITIDRVRVHQSSGAVDADSGWSEVVLSPAKRVDLLSLTNGVLEELGQTALPAGKYTQMRLLLAPNTGSKPLANSVVPTGSAETALTTPSGQQSGIKLNVDIDVAADKVADVVLDFDACKSVVKRGNSGQYNLKPVIAVTPVLSDAGLRVIGFVDPAIAFSSTNVSVQASGVPVKSTVPDASGRFVLYPVPAGTYDLVVTSAGHVTAVMTGVPVTTTAFTNVNSSAASILPPIATARTVTGTVTPPTATVRALQTFSGGPTVEVAWAPVDATSGAFGFTLPIEAPVKTAFVANPLSLSFAADAGAAGKYTLEAASNGATKTQAIDAAAVVPPVAFTFL